MARKYTRHHMSEFDRLAEASALCVMALSKIVNTADDDEGSNPQTMLCISVSPTDDSHVLRGPSFELPISTCRDSSFSVKSEQHWHRTLMSFCTLLMSLGSELFLRIDENTVVPFDPESMPEKIKAFKPQELVDITMKQIEPEIVKGAS